MAAPRNPSSPLMTLASLVIAVAALHVAKEILLPLALAIFISFLLTPVANRLERLGLGRVLSVISVVVASFAIFGVLGWIVTLQLVDLGSELTHYRADLIAKVRQVKPESSVVDELTKTLEDVQKTISEEGEDGEGEATTEPGEASDAEPQRSGESKDDPASTEQPAEAATPLDPPDEGFGGFGSDWEWSWSEGFRSTGPKEEQEVKRPPVDVRIVGTPQSPLQQVLSWLGPLVSPLTTAGICVVLVIFILLSREDQRNRLLQLFGSAHLHATTEALTDLTVRVSKYLRMQFLINAGYGAAVGLGMWLIGVPNAVMWGVLSFSLRFLPYIGPWMSAVMPLLVSIAVFPGWTKPLMVVAWFTVLELLVNNVAEPLLYGHSTGVSGVGVIVAAVFWTWIWGAIGLVLAMPLTVCLVVMARYIPGLHFLTVLLGDQPPLSPDQQIYQRLLAGDVIEARLRAAERVGASSLLEFYDEVLIPALRLAEVARHSGQLHDEQEQAVEETARDLIDELYENHLKEKAKALDDTAGEEKPEQTSGVRCRAFCIPLRDPADELSALMLKQVLWDEGIQLEVAPVQALTGELVESVETMEADLALISILPPLPPRNSRLLCRRLRDRYPDLPVLVGYWCGECSPELEQRLCADEAEIITTLAAAVQRIKAIAARPKLAEGVD